MNKEIIKLFKFVYEQNEKLQKNNSYTHIDFSYASHVQQIEIRIFSTDNEDCKTLDCEYFYIDDEAKNNHSIHKILPKMYKMIEETMKKELIIEDDSPKMLRLSIEELKCLSDLLSVTEFKDLQKKIDKEFY